MYNNKGFLVKSERTVSGFSTGRILQMLFIIRLYVRNHQTRNNLNMHKFAILKPFHCVMGETSDSIIIGITNSNVVFGMQSIVTINKTIPRTNVERHLRKIMEEEVNGKLDGFIKIDKIFFKEFAEALPILDTLNDAEIIEEINNNTKYSNALNEIALKYISKYDKEDNELKFNPIFKARELQIDENLVFCILPFDEDRLEIFNEIIRKELENDFSLNVMRADDIFNNQEIMEDIWTYICKARFIIADISLKNPNVFYELGICHTVGKEVITICDENSLKRDYGGRLPFDIAARRTIFYKNSGAGPKKMVDDLKKHVKTILESQNVK